MQRWLLIALSHRIVETEWMVDEVKWMGRWKKEQCRSDIGQLN